MRDAIRSACYDDEHLQSYAMGSLSRDAGVELELHMATCDACALRVGQMLSEAAASRAWRAETHGEAWRRARLARRLTDAIAAARGALQDALSNWLAHGVASAAGTVRALRDQAGEVAQWVGAGVQGDPMLTVEGVRLRGGGSTGAVARGWQGESTQIRLDDRSRASITIEADYVIVRFLDLELNTPPPPVLVAPEDEATPAIAALAAWNPSAEEWVATLPAPAGDFSVSIGPAESS